MLARVGEHAAAVAPLGPGVALVTVATGEPGALAVAVAEVLAVLGRSPDPG